MPLIKSSSKKAFQSNVGEMVKSGHPVKQAVAAAYATKRKSTGGHMKHKMVHHEKAKHHMEKAAHHHKKAEHHMEKAKHEKMEKKLIGKLSKMHKK